MYCRVYCTGYYTIYGTAYCTTYCTLYSVLCSILYSTLYTVQYAVQSIIQFIVRYNCGGLWGLGARPQPQSWCKHLRWHVEKKNVTSVIWPRGLAMPSAKLVTPRVSASAFRGLCGPVGVANAERAAHERTTA